MNKIQVENKISHSSEHNKNKIGKVETKIHENTRLL